MSQSSEQYGTKNPYVIRRPRIIPTSAKKNAWSIYENSIARELIPIPFKIPMYLRRVIAFTKITKTKEKIKNNDLKIEGLKKKGKELTNEVKERFNLPDQWGFDPETGKIT